eukprot:TRINITY_DN264_c0_g1_i6.p1 TRINITY_DN264_c0_g1~~TRINITY_DN264_c0_g1_i6.p1  ORF type:complete len:582 (+),score=44.99 TRINITY_DN264_c0_g1_i6:35-1780(+)
MRAIWAAFFMSVAFLSLYHIKNERLESQRWQKYQEDSAVSFHVKATEPPLGQQRKRDMVSSPRPSGSQGTAVCASNAMGRWCWKKGTELHDASALVIFGGHGGYEDPLAVLIEEGYAVWKRNTGCATDECATYGDDEAEAVRRSKVAQRGFLNNWGYLGYLSDSSPSRPVLENLVFLSMSSSGGLDTTLEAVDEGLARCRTSNTFTPIHCSDMSSPLYADYFTRFNNLFERPFTGKTARSCSQFILPGTVVNEFPPQLFQKANAMPVAGKALDAKFLYTVWEPLFKDYVGSGPVPSLHPSSTERTYLTAWNDVGFWSWDPAYPDVDRTLVVIGGSTIHPDVELVRQGLKVWKTRVNCHRIHLNAWGEEHHNDLYHVCTESWGYLQYLGDPDPNKVTADYIAFVHGHYEAWHQPGSLVTVISQAVDCTAIRKTYTPLVQYDITDYWVRDWGSDGTAAKWIHIWNEKLGSQPTSQLVPATVDNLSAWAAGSFVIPRAEAEMHPPSFYQLAIKEKVVGGREGFNGFFFEYTWHLFFGQSPVLTRTQLSLRECPDMTYAIKHPKFIRQKQLKLERMENRLQQEGK